MTINKIAGSASRECRYVIPAGNLPAKGGDIVIQKMEAFSWTIEYERWTIQHIH
jgi:hypothetical protein